MFSYRCSDRVRMEDGGEAVVVGKEMLGSGGQGEVYLVEYRGKQYAMKWYTKKDIASNDKFRKNLIKNCRMGAPDSSFIWPLYTAERQAGRDGLNSFGYLMKLFPEGYVGLDDILLGYRFEKVNGKRVRKELVMSLENKVKAALNIANAFMKLHWKGLSYQDLNHGGIKMDVDTGDVMICDCDNVSDEALGIKGYPGYMAPEVVLGGKPDTYSDRHSLAVVLFKLFFVGDPFDGAIQASYKGPVTDAKEWIYYGEHPVFIFDPNDGSNGPVRGLHVNPIKLWPVYPEYIRDLFTQTFTEGLKNSCRRPSDNKWWETLLRLLSDVYTCPDCGKQGFSSSGTFVCKGCGKKYPVMTDGKNINVVLYPGRTLHAYQTEKDLSNDPMKCTGIIIEKQNEPGVYGIRNCSGHSWTAEGTDGSSETLESGKTKRISKINSITFAERTVSGGREEIIYKIR